MAHEYAGQLPLILKVNNSDPGHPRRAHRGVISGIQDALRLGCAAIGFTIYPGSGHRNGMYGEIRD